MKTKRKNRQGFTIIEVMIVLAIAGLIMLIVFLAVPALQRAARNTSRKNDAGNFSSALNTWISNNNGTLPGMEGGSYSSTTCNTDATSIASSIKLGYYTNTATSITCASTSPAGAISVCTTEGTSCAISSSMVGTENIVLAEGVVCAIPQPSPGGSTSMVTTTGAGARSYVVLYAVETGSQPQAECIGG